MLESIKTLLVGHQIANQAQFPEGTAEIIGPWVKSEKDFWWDKELPKKQEYWKYMKFSTLQKREFDVVPPGSQVNRIFEKSPGHICIEIYDLSQASTWLVDCDKVTPLPNLLSNPQELSLWKKFISKNWSSNYFSAINRSFLFSGLAINVSKDQSVNVDIQIKAQHNLSAFLPFQTWLNVEAGSSVVVKETLEDTNTSPFIIYDRLVNIEESSSVKYFHMEAGSKESHIVQNLCAQVSGGATFSHFDMTMPSSWSRHNLDVRLNGRTATSNLSGLYLNDQNYFCDHHTSIEHLAPETYSKQYYKGVLGGNSQSVFNGRVYISEGSFKSNSEQLNKNLLLTNKAEVDTKPELQIYNDDVKAAHGATVGQLNEDELFYLMSRGLNYDTSWDMLCRAFALDLFEEFADVDLDFFSEQIQQALVGMRESNGV